MVLIIKENMQLELIDCPLCGSKNYNTVFVSQDFRYNSSPDLEFKIVKCEICNFKFLNPRPDEKNIRLFYKTGFHRPGSSFAYTIIRSFSELFQYEIIRKIKAYKKEGKVLDIGCGNGYFLSSLADSGFDVYGVEPSSEAVSYFPVNVRGRIYKQSLDDCGFEDNFFDCIVMLHSLEHIHNLEKLFDTIKKIMKPRGVLWLSVPNDNFFESKLFGAYYYNLEIPRHLYFFTKKSLNTILEKKDFKKIEFINNALWELFCTPTSFYSSLKYFLSDKKIFLKELYLFIACAPLILLRFIFRILFVFDNQNINLISKINKTI